MYCVKCGVRLDEGVEQCPLCGSAVWNPDGINAKNHFDPQRMPEESRAGVYFGLSLITVLLAASALSCLIACLNVFGRVDWSGYVVFSILLFYIIFVLPLWFRRYKPVIFIPVSFAAIEGFTLYVCLKTGGNWFLPFAFPVILIVFLFVFLAIGISKYIKRGRLMLIGIYFILLGGSTLLIEFFEHLAFGTKMFLWSLYPLSVFFLVGLFLFIASFIPSVRTYLKRILFV